MQGEAWRSQTEHCVNAPFQLLVRRKLEIAPVLIGRETDDVVRIPERYQSTGTIFYLLADCWFRSEKSNNICFMFKPSTCVYIVVVDLNTCIV